MAGFTKELPDDETQAMKQTRAETECVQAASTERIARAEMFNAIAFVLHSLAKYIDVRKDRR
jgi:hypothetical protein